MFTHYLLITGCEEPTLHADGSCDDENNNEACFFDGGDCCGYNVNTDWCTVCQCLEEGGGVSDDCNTGLIAIIGDGYCDDISNNLACDYDGGDCCGSNVNTDWCTVCQCLEGGGGSTGGTAIPSGTTTAVACNQGWIADGYCDDGNNNLDCTYDGGDCCGSNVNTLYCTECLCLEEGGGGSSGTTTPSATTGNGGWVHKP